MSTTYTPNYNLGKQTDHADKFDMSVLTENADKLDAALHDHDTELADLEANKQENLTSAQLAAVNSGVTAEVLAANRAALVELIDSGAKNHAKLNDFTATLHQVVDVEPIGGTIHLHIGGYTSTDADASNFIIIFRYTDGTTATRTLDKGAVDVEYNLANYVLDRVDIYGSDNWNHSTGDTVTVSELMICSKTAWDISQKYVPTGPSNAELYEMIQALQGSNSLSSVQSTAQPASISAGDNNADS